MRWRAPLALLVLALGTLPAVPPAAAEPEPDFIAVNARGAVPVEHDGGTFVWTADLFSLTTFEKIGTFTDRATCSTSAPPPCLIYDITTTYRVPGGEVTSRGLWSLAPDSTRPGRSPSRNAFRSWIGRAEIQTPDSASKPLSQGHTMVIGPFGSGGCPGEMLSTNLTCMTTRLRRFPGRPTQYYSTRFT